MRLTLKFAVSAMTVLALVAVAAAQQPSPVNRPGADVTSPTIAHEVKPNYTDAAKAQRIEGSVMMDVVVQSDGSVGDVTVTQSLDKTYGLDDEAVRAMKQWRFVPGKKDGKAVPVLVQVEMTFTLK